MIRGIMEEFKGSVGDGYIDFFSVLSLWYLISSDIHFQFADPYTIPEMSI